MQIYSLAVGVCCKASALAASAFATSTYVSAINLHHGSAADLNPYIIAHLSDEKLSYNSVEMTQISCFLMVAEPGFGPGSGALSWISSRLTAVTWDHFEASETAYH